MEKPFLKLTVLGVACFLTVLASGCGKRGPDAEAVARDDAQRLLLSTDSDENLGLRPGKVAPEIEAELVRLQDPKQAFIGTLFHDRLRRLSDQEQAAVIQRLKLALTDMSVEVRRRASLTLHAMGDNSGVPVMIQDMASEDDSTRGNVAVALRIMKDKRAIPVLMKACEDEHAYVRGIALAALGELGAVNAFETISRHLTDKEGDNSSCMQITPGMMACYALGAIGDRRALPLLITALEDESLQSSACQALGKLTGKKFAYNAKAWKDWWQKQQH